MAGTVMLLLLYATTHILAPETFWQMSGTSVSGALLTGFSCSVVWLYACLHVEKGDILL